MSETIAARVGRLISGSVNALIDAVENAAPEMVIEQSIREIDAAADDVRAELGRVIAARHLANKRLLDENSRHGALAEQIELAVREGRDDLAEAAIARQMDIEAQLPVLETTIAQSAQQQKELEGYVSALQGRRREMEAELEAFRAALRRQATVAAGGAPTADDAGVGKRVAGAERAFARAMSSAGVPARAGELKDAVKLAELDDLARRNRIRERLEAAKAGKS
jgi:phage shock protein A